MCGDDTHGCGDRERKVSKTAVGAWSDPRDDALAGNPCRAIQRRAAKSSNSFPNR
jgi:hypothetical protein